MVEGEEGEAEIVHASLCFVRQWAVGVIFAIHGLYVRSDS